jgi:hypothetical protein
VLGWNKLNALICSPPLQPSPFYNLPSILKCHQNVNLILKTQLRLDRHAPRRLPGPPTTKRLQKGRKPRFQRRDLRRRHVILRVFLCSAFDFALSVQPLPSKDEFKEAALPLHVNLMHNPPPIDQVSAASHAPGFMGHIVLTPTVFSTRSYGWKGSKKLLVELQNSEGPDKKKVYVQLNINAVCGPCFPFRYSQI